MFVVDSSGNGFPSVPTIHPDRLVVFTQEVHMNQSSSVYEAISLNRAFDRFGRTWLTEFDYIVKVTGKYIIPSFIEFLPRFPANFDFVVQNQFYHHWQNTELWAFAPHMIPHVLQMTNSVITEQHLMERAVYTMIKNANVFRLPQLDIPLEFRVSRGDKSVLHYL